MIFCIFSLQPTETTKYMDSTYLWDTIILDKMSRLVTKLTNSMCAQRRLRSAQASTQSDQSLRCPHEESLGSLTTNRAHSEDSDQTGRTFAMLKYRCNEKTTFYVCIGHEPQKLFWGIFIFIRRVPPSNLVVVTFLLTSLRKAISYVDDSNATDF